MSPHLGIGEQVQEDFEDLGDVPPQQPSLTLGCLIPSLRVPHDLVAPLRGFSATVTAAEDSHGTQ